MWEIWEVNPERDIRSEIEFLVGCFSHKNFKIVDRYVEELKSGKLCVDVYYNWDTDTFDDVTITVDELIEALSNIGEYEFVAYIMDKLNGTHSDADMKL